MNRIPLILLLAAVLPLSADITVVDQPDQSVTLRRKVDHACLHALRDGKVIGILERCQRPYSHNSYSIHFDKSVTADEAEEFFARCALYCLQQHADQLHLSYWLDECPEWVARFRTFAEERLGRKLVHESEHNEHAQAAFRAYTESILQKHGLSPAYIRHAFIGDMYLWKGSLGGFGECRLRPGPRNEQIGYGDSQALIASGTEADGCTPLHRLARWGQVEPLRQLIAEGADVNAATKEGMTPLHMAAWNGHSDCVRELLAAGADANARITKKWSAYGPTALHYAASEGWVDCLEQLLAAGARVDAPSHDGETPLYRAASQGWVEAIRTLLAAGADVNAALMGSAENREYSMANPIGSTPLHVAARSRNSAALAALLAAGAKVDKADAEGYTALHQAAEHGRLEGVELLLQAGAKVDARTAYGVTPLCSAAWQPKGLWQQKLVGRLLAAGADVNVRLNDGRTPLHAAALFHNAPLIRLLLESGAKADATDDEGQTPLDTATRDGREGEATRLLQEATAQPSP